MAHGERRGRVVTNIIFLEILQKLFVPNGLFTPSNSEREKRAKKISKNKEIIQRSRKIFAFAFTFVWCECALRRAEARAL